MPTETFKTPITELFGIKYPILLAGMNVAAGPVLAAAVTNAGGLGVIGGVGYKPKQLRAVIKELKDGLNDKNAPFGVDLLLPKVGEGARKTNKDYTEGHLDELVDIIIEEKAKVFVSAVGIPPKQVVDRLHAAGIPVMNMIGAPKHVQKALDAGVDIICAQGGEGGGHTGDVPTSILIPKCVDLCRGKKSPLLGCQVPVIAAGGIFDGRGLAMALSLGADAVWVGTRFVCAKEAGATKHHQNGVINAGYHDTLRTTVYTGRPMRVLKNPWALDWETNRSTELQQLNKSGTVVAEYDLEKRMKDGSMSVKEKIAAMPLLMGQAAGAISDIKPAADIINEMMTDAIQIMRTNTGKISGASKL